MLHAPRPVFRGPLLVSLLGIAACSGTIQDSDRPGAAPRPDRGGESGSGAGGLGGVGPMAGHGPPSDDPPKAGCTLPARRIWALTPDQFARSVRALLPGAQVSDGLAASLAVQNGFSNEAGRLDMTEP